MTAIRHLLTLFAATISACAGGCTATLWQGVTQDTLCCPQVVGVDKPVADDYASATLVVKYHTSSEGSPTEPDFAIGIPLDAAGSPKAPFHAGPGDPLGMLSMPRLGKARSSTSATAPATHEAAMRALTPADFMVGEAARRSAHYILAGHPGGVQTGGAEEDDPTTTWIDYALPDKTGSGSTTCWVRLPRHVQRPTGATTGQVTTAVILTPVTVTGDVLSFLCFPFLSVLYPFLGGT